MTKEDILKDLEKNVFCRIARSPIHGVGVIAVREIPKGTNPFKLLIPIDVVPIPEKEIMENSRISEGVKQIVRDFYVIQGGYIYCDARSLNEINISYFPNHSTTPNLDASEANDETIFIANRDIHPGEELTANYATYSDSY